MAAALGVHPAAAAADSPGRTTGTGSATRSTRSSWPGSSARGSRPSPEAERGILLRRVTLDLTGLPPTLAEVDAFERDTAPGRLREGRRSAAGLAPVRRADGDPLAQRGPLRRHQRLSDRRAADHVAVARLGDRRLQPQHAVRPVHDRAARRRPAAGRDARPEDRDRLQPQPSRQRRRGHHPRGIRRRVRRRPRRDHRDRLAGPDARLRPLPQPQVRPDHPGGVLPVLRLLQQRPRERQGGQVRQLAAADQGPDPRPATSSSIALAAPDRPRLERQSWQRREPEIASAQAAWESSIRQRPAFDWSPEEHRIVPRWPASFRRPVGAALGTTATRSSTPATSRGFGFYDKFTLAPGSSPTARAGARSSRGWSTSRRARATASCSTGARSRSTWSSAGSTTRSASRRSGRRRRRVDARRRHLRRLAGRRGRQGLPRRQARAADVLLDELNQSFQTKEPLRIGAGGGPESRFVGRDRRAVDLRPRRSTRRTSRSWRRASRSRRSRAIPPGARTPGQARKIRRCFLATEAPASIRRAGRRDRRRAGASSPRSSSGFPRRWSCRRCRSPRRRTS